MIYKILRHFSQFIQYQVKNNIHIKFTFTNFNLIYLSLRKLKHDKSHQQEIIRIFFYNLLNLYIYIHFIFNKFFYISILNFKKN